MPARDPADRDPLDAVLRPPLDETPEEQAFRLAQEEEARRVSHAIDESIRQERHARKKNKIVRLLLLGQSESGKSTTLRQFQRLYAPSAFREERVLWRAIIQLNLVRSVHTILDALSDARVHEIPPVPATLTHTISFAPSTSPFAYSSTQPGFASSSPPRSHVQQTHRRRTRTQTISGATSDSDTDTSSSSSPSLPGNLALLRTRLAPLQHVEALLITKLAPPSQTNPHGASELANNLPGNFALPPSHEEVFVRPGASWKLAARVTGMRHISPEPDTAQTVLAACGADIGRLWHDPTVKEVLKRRKIRLEESPGFFLDDLDRITSPKYFPSDDDVLKARLKTVGVSEYRFEMEAGSESGTQWRIIDVGGSRSQRPTWVPFFDDVNAIIFLAPISGFDQTLVEDRSVNRLEDSVLLWKAVCANKLLARVNLVLFLNKCDILEAKLTAGVRLAKYVRSFGERSNDAETAQKYFISKFTAIHREYSPIPRKFYSFCTSVTDVRTTGGIIASVRDMIIREHLHASRLL
ncbi:G-alpha-domain-containing protein [Amylocystis lapponica]|nr:G-alpha-domain-containing protein [Amylocystis lapponica]